jgi:hypothetical protein
VVAPVDLPVLALAQAVAPRVQRAPRLPSLSPRAHLAVPAARPVVAAPEVLAVLVLVVPVLVVLAAAVLAAGPAVAAELLSSRSSSAAMERTTTSPLPPYWPVPKSR